MSNTDEDVIRAIEASLAKGPLAVVPVVEGQAPPAGQAREDAYRLRSVRSYRRLVDRMLRLMAQGQIGPQQGKAVIDGCRVGVELYLVEQQLIPAGLDKEQAHEDDGLTGLHVSRFVQRKVTRKKVVRDEHQVPQYEETAAISDEGAPAAAENED